MAIANISGAAINYEIVEPRGPRAGRWPGRLVALSPGGRNPMAEIRGLASLMAEARLSGAAARPAQLRRFRCRLRRWPLRIRDVGGRSARAAGRARHAVQRSSAAVRRARGSRSPMRCATATAVRALLLIRVTGGRFAVDRLIEKYFDVHSRAAAAGGMAAVCETEHFAELIGNRPQNRALLMARRPRTSSPA